MLAAWQGLEGFERRASIDAKPTGLSWEQFEGYLASMTHPRRVMAVDEVGRMAVFMASDGASGMTGTTVNMTMRTLDD